MDMHVLFTHNDLDGVGCGILAKCAFGDEADVRYHSVSSLNPAIESFLEKRHDTKYVFITDLAVDEENERTLQAWFQEGGKVQLIDHHKSALHLDQQKWAQVTVSYEDGRLTSATSLFYDHLIKKNLLIENEALKEFVELVRQYDTWEWEKNENDKAKQLNDLLYLTSIEDFTDSMIHRLQTEPGFAFTTFEEKLLALEDEKIQRYLRKKKRELAQIHVQEHCVGVVHAESYHSELGNILGKEHPHMDYIAILNMGGKRVGFRTIHDHVDVSQVAHTFGGGGHAKAAGCSLTEEAYQGSV
jgi:oligoribonuclease NrnB/cAMP/cGMP phosphodiesterase (DHH superfamily)